MHGVCRWGFDLSRRASRVDLPSADRDVSDVDFFITVLLTAAVSATITWLLLRAREAALSERVRLREEEKFGLADEVTALRLQITKLASEKTQFATQLDA